MTWPWKCLNKLLSSGGSWYRAGNNIKLQDAAR